MLALRTAKHLPILHLHGPDLYSSPLPPSRTLLQQCERGRLGISTECLRQISTRLWKGRYAEFPRDSEAA